MAVTFYVKIKLTSQIKGGVILRGTIQHQKLSDHDPEKDKAANRTLPPYTQRRGLLTRLFRGGPFWIRHVHLRQGYS